jgi:dihydroneopterin aldolase
MTWMLASVAGPDEAEIALAGGADIIDFKDPTQGALGAVVPEVVRAGVLRIGQRKPCSAVLGNIPTTPDSLLPATREMAKTGVDYLKLGIFPGFHAESAVKSLASVAHEIKLIAVFFADQCPDLSLLPLLAECGFSGAMLDTSDKSSGHLLDYFDIAQLSRFTEECRRLHLLMGLAGGLELPDIPRLLLLDPTLLGFRTALCGHQGRNGTIDLQSVKKVRALIPILAKNHTGVDYHLLAARGYGPDMPDDPALTDRVYLRDFVLPMQIGVYAREQNLLQKVRFNVEVTITRARRVASDLVDVFSYDVISDTIRMLADAGHVGLVETLAERIAERLLHHPRLVKVRVQVEKLETKSGVVGIAIERDHVADDLGTPLYLRETERLGAHS